MRESSVFFMLAPMVFVILQGIWFEAFTIQCGTTLRVVNCDAERRTTLLIATSP